VKFKAFVIGFGL